MSRMGKLVVGVSLIIIVILSLSPLIPPVHAQAQHKVKILYISTQGNPENEPHEFLSGVSFYGEVTFLSLPNIIENNKDISLDYLMQFDVIATTDLIYQKKDLWAMRPDIVGNIGQAVSQGKSLIVYIYGVASSPVSGWVTVVPYEFRLRTCYKNLTTIPSTLTTGVGTVKLGFTAQPAGSNYYEYYGILLYGGYPTVILPSAKPLELVDSYHYPVNASIAVYGYYGQGRWAAVDYLMFNNYCCQGNTGRLLSNIMHWLTNREIPPPEPPTRIMEDLSMLKKNITELENLVNRLSGEANEIKQYLASSNVSFALNELGSRINKLEVEVTQLGESVQSMEDKIKGCQATSNITPKLNTLGNEVNELREEVNGLKKSLRGLEVEVTGLSDSIKNLHGKVADLSKSIQSVREEVKHYPAEATSTTMNMNTYISVLAIVIGASALIIALRKRR